MNRPKLKQPIKQPRLLVTNGLKPPDLSEAVKVGAGDWAEVYFQPSSNKVIRAIYPADSTKEMLKRVTQSSYIQNHARKAKIAPRVYSVGMRSDGRIYQTMANLAGYKPIHDTKVDKRYLGSLAKRLARMGIAHNDINTGNIMVSPKGRLKVIDFDTATLKRGGSQSDRDLLTRIGNLYGR